MRVDRRQVSEPVQVIVKVKEGTRAPKEREIKVGRLADVLSD